MSTTRTRAAGCQAQPVSRAGCAAQAPYSFWRLKGLQDLCLHISWAAASEERLHALRQGCKQQWPAGAAAASSCRLCRCPGP